MSNGNRNGVYGLHGYDHFSRAAQGSDVVNEKPFLPQSNSPVQQVSIKWPYQSYFDDTDLARALLPQAPNKPIVNSPQSLTEWIDQQIPGYAIGLHPSSETPVAIQFKLGGQKSQSQPVILKPGQIVRPHGLPPGVPDGSFSGFSAGIPFGWLGGGLATLLVFQTPDADAAWPGNPEIIFHRQRFQIADLTALPLVAQKNWPLRFPWTQAQRGPLRIAQSGQAAIMVEPTRTIARLRVSTLPTAQDMRIIVQESNDFDRDSTDTIISTPVTATDITWGTWASAGGGDLGTQYQAQILPDLITRLGADDGGVLFAADPVLAPDLVGQFVDVVRYGRLG